MYLARFQVSESPRIASSARYPNHLSFVAQRISCRVEVYANRVAYLYFIFHSHFLGASPLRSICSLKEIV